MDWGGKNEIFEKDKLRHGIGLGKQHEGGELENTGAEKKAVGTIDPKV